MDQRTGRIVSDWEQLPEDRRIRFGQLPDRGCPLCEGRPAFQGPSGLWYACPCTEPKYEDRNVGAFGPAERQFMDRLLRDYLRELRGGTSRSQIEARYSAHYDDPVLARWRADRETAAELDKERKRAADYEAVHEDRMQARRDSQVLPDFKRGKNDR